jgi:hypothetical protein
VDLADLDGDQPAIFGLGSDPEVGLVDWLATSPDAPPDALRRLAIDLAPGLALVPRGMPRALAPLPAAHAGAALAVQLRDATRSCVLDAGTASSPAARATVEVADASVVVLRGCYLALRRAVHAPLTARAAGLAVLDEPGRSLGPEDARSVLGRPVLARIPVRAAVARAVDAGVLASRLPEPLARAAGQLLDRISAGVSPACA